MPGPTTTPLPNSPAAVQAAEDAFAAAFASFQEPPAAPAASGTPDEEPADAAPADGAPAEGAPAIPAPAPAASPAEPAAPAAEPAAAAPAPAAPVPAAPTVEAELAALRAELATLKAVPAPAPAAPAAPAPAPAAPEPVYTTDEQAVLKKYQEDWPDIQAGEALVRRGEYRQLVGYIFEQVRQQLQPIAEFATRQQGRTQYDDLVDLVPDYDVVRDPALAWIESQPAYLKAAYQQVAAQGTPQDVADLIARFKRESGYAAPGGAPAPAAAPAAAPAPAAAAPVPAGLPPAAAAAARGLRVVKSGRTEPTPGGDPNDFEGAFAAFANATK